MNETFKEIFGEEFEKIKTIRELQEKITDWNESVLKERQRIVSEYCKHDIDVIDALFPSIFMSLKGGKDMSDNVNHPKHYNKPGRKECIEEMIDEYGVSDVIIFCKLNAHKYLYRFDEKGGAEDLQKGAWYLSKAVELLNRIAPTCCG